MVRKLIHTAASRGMDAAALCKLVSRTLEQLADPDDRIPIEAMYDVWETCMRALGDPAFPLQVAEATQLEDYHTLGYALMTSRDGAEAIHRVVRYGWLISNSGRWELRHESDGELALLWQRAGALRLGHRVANECAIAQFAIGLRRSLSAPSPLRSVFFRHPAPPDVTAHRRLFGVAPRFAADEDGFSVDAATAGTLRSPVATMGLRAMASYFDDQLEALTRAVAPERLPDRAREVVLHSLVSGVPSGAEIAQRLGVSLRSLQRSLSAEGTTVRALIDDARRERAGELIGIRTVTEIAFLLGFSETSALTRAFRRWYGMSPRAYRDRVKKTT